MRDKVATAVLGVNPRRKSKRGSIPVPDCRFNSNGTSRYSIHAIGNVASLFRSSDLAGLHRVCVE